jgi:hypothetical protein
MKKVLLSALFFAGMSVAFTSCGNTDDDDDEPTIGLTFTVTASNVTDNTEGDLAKVRRVAAMAYDDDEAEFVVVSTTYDKGFALKFDKAPDSTALYPVGEEFGMAGVTINNPNVKITFADLEGYSTQSGNFTGYLADFSYGKFDLVANEDGFSVKISGEGYVYADGDVTISGKYTDVDEDGDSFEINFSLSLKKGWNKVYATWELGFTEEDGFFEKMTATSTPITGLAWFFGNFEIDFDDDDILTKGQKGKVQKALEKGTKISRFIKK